MRQKTTAFLAKLEQNPSLQLTIAQKNLAPKIVIVLFCLVFFPPSHFFAAIKLGKKAQWSVIGRAVNDFRQWLVGSASGGVRWPGFRGTTLLERV